MPQLALRRPAATSGPPSSGAPSTGARRSRPVDSRPTVVRRTAPRRAVSVLGGLLVAAVLVVAGGGVASAHDEVLSTSPAADAVVEQVPDEVSLQLSAPALATGTVLAVLAPDGTDLVDGPPVLVDDTVTQPLVADRPAGAYTVQWRVTSADGHPISGSWTFQASAATAAPAPSGTAPSGTDPSAGATSSPSNPEPEVTTYASPSEETSSPTGAESSATTTGDAGEGGGDSSGTAWALLSGAAAIAVLVAGGVALARRRGRD